MNDCHRTGGYGCAGIIKAMTHLALHGHKGIAYLDITIIEAYAGKFDRRCISDPPLE
jgi:hypothetical protein